MRVLIGCVCAGLFSGVISGPAAAQSLPFGVFAAVQPQDRPIDSNREDERRDAERPDGVQRDGDRRPELSHSQQPDGSRPDQPRPEFMRPGRPGFSPPFAHGTPPFGPFGKGGPAFGPGMSPFGPLGQSHRPGPGIGGSGPPRAGGSIFDLLDRNHDGSLSRDEFQHLTDGPDAMRRMEHPQGPPVRESLQHHQGPGRDGVSDGARDHQRPHSVIGRREERQRAESQDHRHQKGDDDDGDDDDGDDDDGDDDDGDDDDGDDDDGDDDGREKNAAENRQEADLNRELETTQVSDEALDGDWI